MTWDQVIDFINNLQFSCLYKSETSFLISDFFKPSYIYYLYQNTSYRGEAYLFTVIQNNKYNFLGEIICRKFRFIYMILQLIISGTNVVDHAPEVGPHQKKTLSQTYSVEGTL